MNRIIHFSDYYRKGEDASYAMRLLLKNCVDRNGITIKFDKDTYDFYPDEAIEASYNISNHGVCGYKRIAMLLKDFKGLEIDGGNSDFVFHGIIIPFVIDGSSDLVIKNLTILWSDPMLVQTKVIGTGEGFVDLETSNETEQKIIDRRIYIVGHNYLERLNDWTSIELDIKNGGPAYQSADNPLRISLNALDAVQIGPRTIRLSGAIGRYPEVGNMLLLRAGRRYAPGIFIKDSANVLIENVKIFYSMGMAVIAQKSSDITLLQIKVVPNPNKDVYFSANADATHFVNCKGKIIVKDCVFTQQMDDALNIHGIYMQVVRILSDRKIMVRLVHEEQQGVDVFAKGDEVRFVRSSCLQPLGENCVQDVEFINIERSIITFENPIPEDLEIRDCLENLTWTAELLMTNCIIKNNRARGLLISSGGKIEVVNNYISSSGAGILISGDCNYWFESGAVKDVTIENNIFEDCTYVPQWGMYNIIIHPEVLQPDLAKECFHKNIRIKNNIFKTFSSGIVQAYCVDGLILENNRIDRTTSYPDHSDIKDAYEYSYCRNVTDVHDIDEEL